MHTIEHEDRVPEDEHVGRASELAAILHGKLIDAAYDELANGHVDVILVRDARGRAYAYHLSRPEAQKIEEAGWSADGDPKVDAVVNDIIRGAARHGVDVNDPEHLDLEIQLHSES